ncbi:MAG: hypothetical protein HQ534_08220 [Armatimonadetes bacterium]|nr:hypothetical protein [Armatimonadota bacterium]
MFILYIFLFLILSFLVFDFITLYKIRKLGSKDKSMIPDEKYFDLKYKIQYLISIFSVILFIVGFLGYNSLKNIETKISDKMSASILDLESRIAHSDTIITRNEKSLKEFESEQKKIQDKLDRSNTDVSKLSDIVNELKKKTFLNPKIYICHFTFDEKKLGDSNGEKFYFRDISTIDKNELPFKKEPSLFFSATINIEIIEITKEYFKIGMFAYSGNYKIDMLILYKEE